MLCVLLPPHLGASPESTPAEFSDQHHQIRAELISQRLDLATRQKRPKLRLEFGRTLFVLGCLCKAKAKGRLVS